MEINEIYNEDNLKISKHFIAYLDILGYEKHLDHWAGPEMLLATMSTEIENTRKGIKLTNDYAGPVDVKLKVFSDNFLLCSENGWESLLYFVMSLNLNLMRNNIFVRGSLCYDDLYFSNEFLLGRGIIKAHKIESELAIYPRIIVDNSFREGAKSVSSGGEDEIFEWYFSEDGTDGFWHLDYLKAEHNYSTRNGRDAQRTLTIHRDSIISNIEKHNNEKDRRIFQKYQWCKKYHNNFCKNYGYSIYTINNHF